MSDSQLVAKPAEIIDAVAAAGERDAITKGYAMRPSCSPPADGPPDYGALLAGARAGRITVSSVGIDVEHVAGFMDHMRLIAEAGGGAFSQSGNGDDIPGILLGHTATLLRSWYEQDPFFPTVTSAGDLLDGVPLDAFPQLGGYVVTTPKPTADVLLAGPRATPPGRRPVRGRAGGGVDQPRRWPVDRRLPALAG